MCSTTALCRLCVRRHTEFQVLVDENGQNEFYKVAIQYFDEMYLTSKICKKCWDYINEFNTFRESVFEAQSNFEDDEVEMKPLVKLEDSLMDEDGTNIPVYDSVNPQYNNPFNTNDEQTVLKNSLLEIRDINNSEEEENESTDYGTEKDDNEYTDTNSEEEENKLTQNTSEEEHQCPHCSLKFNNTPNQRNHIRRVHPQEFVKLIDILTEDDVFISEWKQDLECDICKDKFKRFILLSQHFKNEHPSVKCYYKCCDMKLFCRPEIKKHIRLHMDPNSDKCSICEKYFVSRNKLNVHYRTVHSEELTKIDDPDESEILENDDFTQETAEQSSYKCPYCPHKVKHQRNVRRHIQLVHPQKFVKRPENPYQDDDDFIAKWKENLECNECNTTFKNFSSLNKHFKSEHPNAPASYVKCCDIKLVSRTQIVKHIKLHLDPNSDKCGICGKCFKTVYGLNIHLRKVHDENPVDPEPNTTEDNNDNEVIQLTSNECTFCGFKVKATKRYGWKHGMRAHMKRKHPKHYAKLIPVRNVPSIEKTLEEDAYISKWQQHLECDICKQTFENFSFLRDHFKCEHPDIKLYFKCCEVKLFSRPEIADHIRHHLEPNSFKCEICGVCYSCRRSLSRHIKRLHSDSKNERPYECEVCKKGFRQLTKLKDHIGIHIAEKNYRCKECDREFSTNELLKKHVYTYHYGSRLCDQCGKSFIHKYALQEHLLVHEQENRNCDICGIELNSKSELKHHKFKVHNDRSNVFECSECENIYMSRESLYQHRRIIHKGVKKIKIQCDICFKQFATAFGARQHKLTHTNGKVPIQCPHCDILIKDKKNLPRHIKIAHPQKFEEKTRPKPNNTKTKIDSSVEILLDV